MADQDQETTVVESGAGAPVATGERAAPDDVREALCAVLDPEIGIDIVGLGLVYGVDIDEAGMATVTMTLTTPFCPLGPYLETEVRNAVTPLPGITGAQVALVWDPPWDPRTMASEEARLELGIY
ncbi:MAG TPA: metal-sulfur cluster assembly factor [Candidatus Dormibacteraeota bacterium]|nr:metal-sulfur cluster assembly factor [Candidatus Dormibacteraeota bacterium]